MGLSGVNVSIMPVHNSKWMYSCYTAGLESKYLDMNSVEYIHEYEYSR